MRLFQDQIYRQGGRSIRIVRLDRYEVEYKTGEGGERPAGEPVVLRKKEFCRLIRGMTLETPPPRAD